MITCIVPATGESRRFQGNMLFFEIVSIRYRGLNVDTWSEKDQFIVKNLINLI